MCERVDFLPLHSERKKGLLTKTELGGSSLPSPSPGVGAVSKGLKSNLLSCHLVKLFARSGKSGTSVKEAAPRPQAGDERAHAAPCWADGELQEPGLRPVGTWAPRADRVGGSPRGGRRGSPLRGVGEAPPLPAHTLKERRQG